MTKVSVYKNLRNGRYMVRAVGGPDDGKVIGSCLEITLIDVSLNVVQLAAEKVKLTGRRSKHAFAVGSVSRVYGFKAFKRHIGTETSISLRWLDQDIAISGRVLRKRLTYNPMTDTAFMANGIPTYYVTFAFLSKARGNWVAA